MICFLKGLYEALEINKAILISRVNNGINESPRLEKIRLLNEI